MSTSLSRYVSPLEASILSVRRLHTVSPLIMCMRASFFFSLVNPLGIRLNHHALIVGYI